ncbi:radical SAM protein [candidate division KSB1 bacterium]|nr:radical SAM protein [candidate division KSB1 bacterium]
MIPKKPILLHYFITTTCNCRCQFCDIWKQQERHQARLSDVLQNLTQAKRLGIRFVDFTGGEPLMHPHLPEMLLYAKRLGLMTTLTTNGLLYPERSKELVSLVDLLHISLDAADESDHNTLRNADCYHSALLSIDKALTLKQVPDILFTVNKANLKHVAPLVKLAQSLHIMLIINPVFPISASRLSNVDLDYLLSFANKPFVYINKAIIAFRKNGGNDNMQPRCRVGDAVIVISSKNTLLLPCFHHHVFAVALENDLLLKWNSKVIRNQRKKQGCFPFCKGCVISCYFDPSFLYTFDRLYFQNIFPKFKYAIDKYIRRHILNWMKGNPCSAATYVKRPDKLGKTYIKRPVTLKTNDRQTGKRLGKRI